MRRTFIPVVAVVLMTALTGFTSSAVGALRVGTAGEANQDAGVCQQLEQRTGVDVCGMIDCTELLCNLIDLVNCPDLDPTYWFTCLPEVEGVDIDDFIDLVPIPNPPPISGVPDAGQINEGVEDDIPVGEVDDDVPIGVGSCQAQPSAPHMKAGSTTTIAGSGWFECPRQQYMQVKIWLKVKVAKGWHRIAHSARYKPGIKTRMFIRTQAQCTPGSWRYRTVIWGEGIFDGFDRQSATSGQISCHPNAPRPLEGTY